MRHTPTVRNNGGCLLITDEKASGGLLQISEMQSRWFCEHIVGNLQLPPAEQMEAEFKGRNNHQMSAYSGSDRHTIQTDPLLYWLDMQYMVDMVNFTNFSDDIGDEFGARPTLLSNPSLAIKLLFSSAGAAQYRLQVVHFLSLNHSQELFRDRTLGQEQLTKSTNSPFRE